MSDHDPDLHRRLRDLDPPPHRDGFWNDVRAGLDAESGAGAGDGAPTPLRVRRRLPPRPLLAAAAVVAVVALVGIGVLITRDDPDAAEVVTEPGPGPTAATEPGPSTTAEPGAEPDDQQPGPLRPAGDPVERGSGTPVAVDPQGRFLYVADDAPAGGTGCEGAPRQALFAEPVGGGSRQLVLPAEQLDATGRIDLWFSGDGRVAARSLCEGFGHAVTTATVADDGTFTEVFQLTAIPELDAGREADVDALGDLAWTPHGQLVATTRWAADDGSEHRHLYSFPPAPSEASDLEVDGAIQVEITDDGTIVTLHDDGTVRVDGEELFAAGEAATALDVAAVSEDGSDGEVVVAGPGLRVGSVGAPDIGPALPLPAVSGEVTDAELVEGTSAIVYLVAGPDGYSIRAVDASVPDRDGELAARDGPTRFVLAPDGSRLFTTRGPAEDPVVIETPLER